VVTPRTIRIGNVTKNFEKFKITFVFNLTVFNRVSLYFDNSVLCEPLITLLVSVITVATLSVALKVLTILLTPPLKAPKAPRKTTSVGFILVAASTNSDPPDESVTSGEVVSKLSPSKFPIV
jgi:hypothetical protein